MKILLVIAVVLLTACGSEFDKCMRTELARAEEGLNISQCSKLERATECGEAMQEAASELATAMCNRAGIYE